MTWTQAQCDDCFFEERPEMRDRTVHRMKEEFREEEICCTCGKTTTNGLYVRKDPKTVPYPRKETDG